jgi:hypothetical protein
METVIKKNRPLKPGTPAKRESQIAQTNGKSGVNAVPDNGKSRPPSDNDQLAPELENSSNKGQGPAGENL